MNVFLYSIYIFLFSIFYIYSIYEIDDLIVRNLVYHVYCVHLKSIFFYDILYDTDLIKSF